MKSARRPKSSLTRAAVAAMQDAVANVIEDHRRRGMPLAVWEGGKIVLLKPGKPLTIRERPSAYTARKKKKVLYPTTPIERDVHAIAVPFSQGASIDVVPAIFEQMLDGKLKSREAKPSGQRLPGVSFLSWGRLR